MSEENPEELLHKPERRKGYKEISRTIDERMGYLEDCFQRWLRRGLVAFAIIGMTSAFGLLGYGIVLKQQNDSDTIIKKIALDAHDRSETAIELTFNREKICADSSPADPCRALFDRLARSLSTEQRKRLACAVVKNLEGEEARSILKKNPNCGG